MLRYPEQEIFKHIKKSEEKEKIEIKSNEQRRKFLTN
jgi:hypothetical protein